MEDIIPVSKKLTNLSDKIRAKVSNVLENTLALNWIWIVLTWMLVSIVMIIMSQAIVVIGWISVGLLATYVTKWIHRGIGSVIPKKLIKDTAGKVVVITGCDTGFGHQLAVKLDILGFKVFAGCLSPEGEGGQELARKGSETLRILQMDVTNEDTVIKAYEEVKKYISTSGDRLWALVNNAGIAVVTEIEWCPMEVYQKIFDVNTLGLLRVTKAFLPLIRQHDGNRIIIVASLAGRYTFPGFSAYSMSKHAAVSFADGLRLEMKKWDISVHTVEPTLYRTPITEESLFRKNLDKLWKETPEDIRKSYGNEYLQDFKSVVSSHLRRAKPIDKIHEVIDDMVDAVAGERPKCRYVPSLETQLRVQFLSSLPREFLDKLFVKSQPRTPPADLDGAKRNRFSFSQ